MAVHSNISHLFQLVIKRQKPYRLSIEKGWLYALLGIIFQSLYLAMSCSAGACFSLKIMSTRFTSRERRVVVDVVTDK